VAAFPVQNLHVCKGNIVNQFLEGVDSQPPEQPGAGQTAAPSAKVREVDSEELFQGQKTVVIRHGAEVYRLLLTRHNKLILQK
jgi:hemin uptake protein HemP